MLLRHLARIGRNDSTSQNDNNIIENQTEPHVIEDPPVNEIFPNNEHFNLLVDLQLHVVQFDFL